MTQLTAIHPTDVERMTGVFQRMPKIPRLFRDVIVTEKLDGTNASIFVGEDGAVVAASRTRWITPVNDNYGFARWVAEREDDIRAGLGVGHHFGEWFGNGIQRAYGLSTKQFALFNVSRWLSANNAMMLDTWIDKFGEPFFSHEKMLVPPPFMTVVPIIDMMKKFDTARISETLEKLRQAGSIAVPGFMRPEGVVVYHRAGDALFKATLDKNDGNKEG
jgi:hypothetical protein